MAKKFSTPYGDGTMNKIRNNAHELVFAPLRGWYAKEVFVALAE